LSRGSSTPRAHRRGDLGQQFNSASSRSPFHRREVVLVRENQSGQLTSESHIMPTSNNDEDGQRVIWGTNVSIADSMKKFRDFLLGFQKKYRLRAENIDVEDGEGEEYTYVEMLKTVYFLIVKGDFRCVKLIFRP
jgi:DNA replication licensing factor MCM4